MYFISLQGCSIPFTSAANCTPGVDRSMPFYIALGGGWEVSGARWWRAGVEGGGGARRWGNKNGTLRDISS